MVRVTGEQLQKSSGVVRSEARRAPVEVTYHGRPELVVLSVEDYALLRQNLEAVAADFAAYLAANPGSSTAREPMLIVTCCLPCTASQRTSWPDRRPHGKRVEREASP
jgi:prevent-host-death family protein